MRRVVEVVKGFWGVGLKFKFFEGLVGVFFVVSLDVVSEFVCGEEYV